MGAPLNGDVSRGQAELARRAHRKGVPEEGGEAGGSHVHSEHFFMTEAALEQDPHGRSDAERLASRLSGPRGGALREGERAGKVLRRALVEVQLFLRRELTRVCISLSCRNRATASRNG